MLDAPNKGRHYDARMQHILAACQDCGILWHVETMTLRNGVTQQVRVDDVTSAGEVVVTPRYEKYALQVSPRVLNRVKSMAPQFALAMNVPRVSIEVAGALVYVRVPKERDGRTVAFEDAWRLAPVPAGSLLLGMNDDGQQLVLPFDAGRPHCAVIGMTGSGKTTLMRVMILSALMNKTPVALFDPLATGASKGLAPLSGHPQVWRGGIFTVPDQCVAGLIALLHEHRGGRLFVFVDEAPDLMMQSSQAREVLTQIAQRGRHSGLHLILGAQHPLTSELPAMRNIPVRLVGKVADRQAAYNASGLSNTGCELLQGAGDFMAFTQGQPVHFQAATIPRAWQAKWVQQYPPRLAQAPLKAASGGRVAPAPVRASLSKGRPTEPPAEGCIRAIIRYRHKTGTYPSSNWIREWTQERYGAMYGRAKAQRALDVARTRLQEA